MSDEGQGLAPDTPFSGPTESATPAPATDAGATPAAAPTVEVGGKTYTLEEVQQNLANYQQLQGHYTRASQDLARAREAVDFANALERYPDIRDQFVAQLEQRVRGIEARTPEAAAGEQNSELVAIRRELDSLKQERAIDWARGQWNDMRSKFEGIMGRRPTPQEEMAVQQYLDRTGAADLWSATLAVFQNPFMDRAAVLKEQRANLATQTAQGNVTEGAGAAAPDGPIDWSKASMEEQVAKARKMAGGEPDPTYNPFVDFGTQR